MLEPGDLVLVEGLIDREAVGAAIRALALNGELLTRRKGLEALDAQPIKGTNLQAVICSLTPALTFGRYMYGFLAAEAMAAVSTPSHFVR